MSSRASGLVRSTQQAEISLQRRMPVDGVGSDTLTQVSAEAVQFQYYNAGVLTVDAVDAGEAAGTLIVAKLANRNVRNALGDVTGSHVDTSFAFITGTTLTTLKPFNNKAAEDAERSGKTSEEKAQDITSGFTNGEFCIDHRTGSIYGIKADAGTSDTADYKIQATSVSGGAGGDATAANQTTQIALETTIRDNTNTPSVVANAEKTVTTAGTAEALAATTTIKSVVIQPLSTNTGNVYVGDSGVSSANGLVLAVGEAVSFPIDDPATVFIDVDTNGEGVRFLTVAP